MRRPQALGVLKWNRDSPGLKAPSCVSLSKETCVCTPQNEDSVRPGHPLPCPAAEVRLLLKTGYAIWWPLLAKRPQGSERPQSDHFSGLMAPSSGGNAQSQPIGLNLKITKLLSEHSRFHFRAIESEFGAGWGIAFLEPPF